MELIYLLVDDPSDTFCAGWSGEGASVMVIFVAVKLYVSGVDLSDRSLFLPVDQRSNLIHQLPCRYHISSKIDLFRTKSFNHLSVDSTLEMKSLGDPVW